MQFARVHYYTIRVEKRQPEFSDFVRRMAVDERDADELAEINRYIEQIGEHFGAYPVHFRKEDDAEGLPPPYHDFIGTDMPNDYGLRLYCIRLTPSIVILLNGDRKSARKVQQCGNCYKHFNLARRLSRQITSALVDGFITINEVNRIIEQDEDFELEI